MKEGSRIINRDQAEKIALDDVSAWKGVKNAKIESIKKIHVEDDEYSYWDVNGKYEWNEGKSGSFGLSLSEVRNILLRWSVAYPIPHGKSVPFAPARGVS